MPFKAWCKQLEKRLKILNGAGPRYKVRVQLKDKTGPTMLVEKEHHGVTSSKVIHRGFFGSPEYQRIAAIGAELKDLMEPGAWVSRGKERKEVASFAEAMDWFMAQAKQGQSIQRYKGLGEMNPDQLWETTVNPDTRLLMQVRIGDAFAANDVFETLMGDNVEPRREFIESNALAVANLDV